MPVTAAPLNSDTQEFTAFRKRPSNIRNVLVFCCMEFSPSCLLPSAPGKVCHQHTAERNMTAYDGQNIFAKVLRGEIPCYKVYENRHTFAFLDIMPRSPGHTLVIPKAAARGILDIAADDFAEVARTAKKIAVAAVQAFDAEGIIVQQFSEAASGQVVFHLHMHVMPMKTGVDLLPAQTRKEDTTILEVHAAKMIAALRD
jgi:histidine triad (HIT) family protein